MYQEPAKLILGEYVYAHALLSAYLVTVFAKDQRVRPGMGLSPEGSVLVECVPEVRLLLMESPSVPFVLAHWFRPSEHSDTNVWSMPLSLVCCARTA